jgi:hypothetical protein
MAVMAVRVAIHKSCLSRSPGNTSHRFALSSVRILWKILSMLTRNGELECSIRSLPMFNLPSLSKVDETHQTQNCRQNPEKLRPVGVQLPRMYRSAVRLRCENRRDENDSNYDARQPASAAAGSAMAAFTHA